MNKQFILFVFIATIFSPVLGQNNNLYNDSLKQSKKNSYWDSINRIFKITKWDSINCIAKPSKDTLQETRRILGIDFSINSGISLPLGEYGSNYYYFSENPVYCGFASPGYTYNVTIDIILKNGWEFSLIGNYIHNDFNATGYLNENSLYLNELGQSNVNPKAIGTYSYNLNAIFGGITKDFYSVGRFSFACRFVLGQFFANIPAISGIASNSTGGTANINLPAENSGQHLGMDMGIRLAVRILSPISVLLNSDYVFSSSPTTNGGVPYTSNISMFNCTLGISYKF